MATTRRDLLSRLGFGLTFLPALAMAPRSVVGSLLFEPDGVLVPAKPLPPNPFTRDGKALVAIVYGQDPSAALRAGLEMLGGLDRLALQGKRVLTKPDVFINLPVVKTHRFAHYSCSLKNLVGITHPRYRPSVSFLAGDWQERIAELNLAVHPHLSIADGTTIMIAGGPTSGTPARTDLLLLSGDRVALDAVGVALIRTFGAWPKVAGMTVWKQRQIRKAIELGLGASGPHQVELLTRSLAGPDAGFDKLVDTIRRDLSRA